MSGKIDVGIAWRAEFQHAVMPTDPRMKRVERGFGTLGRARAHHDIGEHASSQDEPRLGLGNVTRLLLGDDAHIGDLGSLLGVIDGDPATNCP